MDFKKYLSSAREKVEKEALRNITSQEKSSSKQNRALKPLLLEFKKSMSGGKCLRGTLVLLGYKLAGGKKDKTIISAAAAYEILHCSLLAHDDIMDKSLLRRGKKSLYRTLGGDHTGISQAICLGDFGIFLANRMLNSLSLPPDKKTKAFDIFVNTCISTAFGQMLDIKLPTKKPLEKDIIDIYYLKTARYSFIGPLLLGAVLGGAPLKIQKNLEDFGKNLGIAFQIKDDILGIFGDEKELGKSVTSDIEEGKNTLLYFYALKSAENRKFLKNRYGKGEISRSDFLKIKKIYNDCGALEYAQNQASSYTASAKKTIPRISNNPTMQKLLWGLADFLMERNF